MRRSSEWMRYLCRDEIEVDKFALNGTVTGVTDMDNGIFKFAQYCLVTLTSKRVLARPIILSLFSQSVVWICIFIIVCCCLLSASSAQMPFGLVGN